jgi:hypothetical protein
MSRDKFQEEQEIGERFVRVLGLTQVLLRSFGSGTGSKGALAVRFCPSICVELPASMPLDRSAGRIRPSRPTALLGSQDGHILDKMPKSVQGKAKQLIHEMYLAPTRKAALQPTTSLFPVTKSNSRKPANACTKIKKCSLPFTISRPNIGRIYGRLTNPIESTFATVRLRTHRTKGCGSRIATLTMVFKLGLEAQKHWRRLQGFELIPKVVTGVRFVDGEEQTQQAA